METISKKTKRQRFLTILFILLSLATILNIYFGYFKKRKVLKSTTSTPTFEEKKVQIDFSVLENPLLKELQPFEKIPPPKAEEVGRENPFLPIK